MGTYRMRNIWYFECNFVAQYFLSKKDNLKMGTTKNDVKWLFELDVFLYITIKLNCNMIRQLTGKMQIIHMMSWKYLYNKWKQTSYHSSLKKNMANRNILLSVWIVIYVSYHHQSRLVVFDWPKILVISSCHFHWRMIQK